MSGPVMIADDEGAMRVAMARGQHIPPMFEEIRSDLGTQFRRMFRGWRVADPATGADHGYVAVCSSADGEDWEIMADGGWTIREARKLFRWVFEECGQSRVSARCKAMNERNVRALQRMGFVIEGRKRLADGDTVIFGMLREECRLLRGA